MAIIQARLKYALKSWFLFARRGGSLLFIPFARFLFFVCAASFFVSRLFSYCFPFLWFSLFRLCVWHSLFLFIVFGCFFLWHFYFLPFVVISFLLSFFLAFPFFLSCFFLVPFPFPFVRWFLLCLSLLSYCCSYIITIIINIYLLYRLCVYVRTHAHAHDKDAHDKAQKKEC